MYLVIITIPYTFKRITNRVINLFNLQCKLRNHINSPLKLSGGHKPITNKFHFTYIYIEVSIHGPSFRFFKNYQSGWQLP